MTNPQGTRVSYLYHKSQDPTYASLMIDNKPYILMERLSRSIVDTKELILIPWAQTNNVASNVNQILVQTLPTTQTENTRYSAPLISNIEQQLNLQKMYAAHVMDEQSKVKLNANPQLMNAIPVTQQYSAAVQTCFYRDNSTNVYEDDDIAI